MKKRNSWFLLIFQTIFWVFMLVGNAYSQMDRSGEIEEYRHMLLSTSSHQRVTAAKKLTTSGISDEALFDLIRGILLERYQDSPDDPQQIDEMSWMCKALASSGIEKYKADLQTVADGTGNRKLKGYAIQSLGLLDKYARRNKVISDDQYLDQGFSEEEARYMNMLDSVDLVLVRNAAKMIFREGLLNERVYEKVHEVLLRENGKMPKEKQFDEYGEEIDYGLSRKAKLQIDAISWLCKALGASGKLKYRETLDKIAKTSIEDRISKHARDSYKMLQ